MQVALAYLGVAARTRAEVERKLKRSGFHETTVAAVLEDLERSSLLDDRAFALAWVESRSRSRKLGHVRLGAELRRKGVAPEIIAEALASLTAESELEQARTLAKTLLGGADPADPKVRRRLAGYLLRRGHGWDTIEEVLADILSNQDP